MPETAGCARRHRNSDLRSAATAEFTIPATPAALCRATVGEGRGFGHSKGETALAACGGRRSELVLAGRRGSRRERWPRNSVLAGALRSGGLGSGPLRTAVGMGVPLRGIHARSEAGAGVLRLADPLARSSDRLGKLGSEERRTAMRLRVCDCQAEGASV